MSRPRKVVLPLGDDLLGPLWEPFFDKEVQQALSARRESYPPDGLRNPIASFLLASEWSLEVKESRTVTAQLAQKLSDSLAADPLFFCGVLNAVARYRFAPREEWSTARRMLEVITQTVEGISDEDLRTPPSWGAVAEQMHPKRRGNGEGQKAKPAPSHCGEPAPSDLAGHFRDEKRRRLTVLREWESHLRAQPVWPCIAPALEA